eukprot:scaffold23642_cov20-Tisochrysis_lutea.AAC.2
MGAHGRDVCVCPARAKTRYLAGKQCMVLTVQVYARMLVVGAGTLDWCWGGGSEPGVDAVRRERKKISAQEA